MIGPDTRHVEILLVEDNEGDVFLTRKAFQGAKIANTLRVAEDGEIALKMLSADGPGSKRFVPDIVLLDINLPKLDGKQVLAEMKKDPDLRRIPVIMLTSSEADQDVLSTYDLQASGYIVKPVDFEKLRQVVCAIESFWFSIVTLPTES